MSQFNEQIRAKIDSFDVDGARQLLRQALNEADAETYYLASQVALNDNQKRDFLQKAVQLDPFHAQAQAELNNLSHKNPSANVVPQMNSQPINYPQPQQAPYQPYQPTQPHTEKIVINGQEFILADFGSRSIAYIVDGIVVSFLAFILTLLIVGLVSILGLEVLSRNWYTSYDYGFNMNRIGFGVYIGSYLIIILSLLAVAPVLTNRQTIGKQLVGIKIIPLTEKLSVSFWQAFLRNVIGYHISGLIIIGFLWSLWDPQRQTWHDKLAQTVVVKVPRQM